MMKHCKIFILSLFLFTALHTVAQTDAWPVFKGAIKANREKMYNYIIKNSIAQNLSLPLSDSTEADWEDAFNAMELINYKEPWVNEKIKTAFENIDKRSTGFQRALTELVYTNYVTAFKSSINQLFTSTRNAKIFAMCAEYLLRADKSKANVDTIAEIVWDRTDKYFQKDMSSSFTMLQLLIPIMQTAEPEGAVVKLKIEELLNKDFLHNNVVVYSIQRKNRDFAGIAVVRDTAGNFIPDAKGNIFSVSQLARSITNMPCYLTNGNTPQGIFRMHGFAVSKSPALGPTENIQLMMPYETSIQTFLRDSSITDTSWEPELYEQLLPASLKKYKPLYQTFYASAIGRTEIIAHGTTVDPEFYKGQPYYPHTPTAGCLCTNEIWSEADGKRLFSNQQKLVDAIKKAGGAEGYLIVIEIDDQQKPVSINEILPYLKTK